MKLKYKMEIMDMGGSPMAVPADCDDDFRSVLHMNGTTADILKILEHEVTEAEIVSALEKEYDASENQIRSSVREIVSTLRENHLLIE